jgi:hypothetical protein
VYAAKYQAFEYTFHAPRGQTKAEEIFRIADAIFRATPVPAKSQILALD